MIGNPPYFKYEANHKGEIEELKKQEELKISFGGKLNAYKLFLAKAISSLTCENGLVVYIFQNSFLGDLQAYILRKAVIEDNQLISIDSFPERDNVKKRVFESVKMSVCIPIIRKKNTHNDFIVNFWEDKNKAKGFSTIFNRDVIISIDPDKYTIPKIQNEEMSILTKLLKFKRLPLKCWEGELNMTFHKSYFTSDAKNPPILKGASIQRYYFTEKMSQGVIEYLCESRYLQDFSGEKCEHHKFERIAMQGMTGANDKIRLVMALIPEGIYLANSCNYLLPTKEFPSKYLLGLMNSKLTNWFFRCFSTNSNVNGYEVEKTPIPTATSAQQQEIVTLVDKILLAKKQDSAYDTTDLERKIDRLVYELYGLTEEEIKIIENK